MSKQLKIISIDGTRGSGKSSQIAMLAKHFKGLGMAVLTLKVTDEDPLQSRFEALDSAQKHLESNSGGLVILDGSIARPMVKDLTSGMSSSALAEKYKHLTHQYEKLDHQYQVASFLIVMDDLSESCKRLEKRAILANVDFDPAELSNESDIVSGMRFFNNHISSKNVTFESINITAKHSMMDINKEIMKKLSLRYIFDKPKADYNEW